MIAIITLLLTLPIFAASQKALTEEELVDSKVKMESMVAKDQAIRFEILTLQRKYGNDYLDKNKTMLAYWKQIDGENTKEVKEILSKRGWPEAKVFGNKYCNGIWLLTQHADSDIELQKLALKYLEKLAINDKAVAKQYAYLFDRIQVHNHLPQRYGTQGFCLKKNHWQPYRLEDGVNIDSLRQSVGLTPFNDYRILVNRICP